MECFLGASKNFRLAKLYCNKISLVTLDNAYFTQKTHDHSALAFSWISLSSCVYLYFIWLVNSLVVTGKLETKSDLYVRFILCSFVNLTTNKVYSHKKLVATSYHDVTTPF